MITTLQVPYADVRAADLRWSDSARRLPALERLEVAIAGGGRLELAIVGCSHQVVVDAPWLHLAETVARLPQGGRPLAPRSARTEEGAWYAIEVEVDRGGRAAFDVAVGRLLAELEDASDTVVGRFPGRPGAVTALRCDRAGADGLAWRTWHTYPGTGEIVSTQTVVRRP